MRTTIKIISSIFIILSLVYSCKNNDNDLNPQDELENISYIDISDALSIVIIEGDTTNNRLMYKITEDGKFKQVYLLNDDKDTVNYAEIDFIIDDIFISSKSKIILDGDISIKTAQGQVKYINMPIIEYSTGRLYETSNIDDLDKFDLRFSYSHLVEDSQENLYFDDSQEGLVKANISDISNITIESLLPPEETFTDLDVDKFGNIIYKKSTYNIRVRNINGRIFELSNESSSKRISTFWTDSKKDIYCLGEIGEEFEIVKIEFSNDTIHEIIQTSGISLPSDLFINESSSYIVNKDSSTFFIAYFYEKNYEYSNYSVVVSLDIPKREHYRLVEKSNDHIYIVDGTNLYKMSMSDKSLINLFPANTYSIYDFAVTSNNIVTFSALDFTNSKKIFGMISANGEITVIDKNLNKKALSLESLK